MRVERKIIIIEGQHSRVFIDFARPNHTIARYAYLIEPDKTAIGMGYEILRDKKKPTYEGSGSIVPREGHWAAVESLRNSAKKLGEKAVLAALPKPCEEIVVFQKNQALKGGE